MPRRLLQFALLALALFCVAVLDVEPVQAREALAAEDAAPVGDAVEPQPEPEPVSGETLALEAAKAQSEHCAAAYREDTTKAARSITAVGDVWARLSEQYEKSGESFLLYWRGVLAQCMDQEERGLRDLEAFVAESASSPLWASLVKDARRRLRQLGRKTGRSISTRATGGPPPGVVLGISLTAGSLASGIAAADRWRIAIERGDELEDYGKGGGEHENINDGNPTLESGLREVTASRVLGAVSAGLGTGAVVAFIITAVSGTSSHAAISPPVLLPTAGGAAVLWELRW